MAADDRHFAIQLRISRRLGIALLCGIAGIIVLSAAGVAWRHHKHQTARPVVHQLFSSTVKSQAGFPLYQPAKLPAKFSASAGSVHLSESVLTFSITATQNQPLAVSEQAIPKNFDFKQFYKINIELPQQSDTPTGKVTTGKFNGLPVCMLVTPTTWIIINNPSNASIDLGTMCKNLRIAS